MRLCVAPARGDCKHSDSYYCEEEILHTGIIDTSSDAGR